jgi:hypothetical protein
MVMEAEAADVAVVVDAFVVMVGQGPCMVAIVLMDVVDAEVVTVQ